MDTATLRWILLVLGLLLLAGIYLWGVYQPLDKLRRPKKTPPAERSEPVLDPHSLPVEAEAAAIPAETAGTTEAEAPENAQEPQPLKQDEVVIIRIVGQKGAWLRGADICMAADRTGLSYQNGLYHRMLESDQGEQIWYSLANVQEPGSFDLDRMDELHTPAVLLYFPLPNPMGALDSFDAMLATAERLTEILEGRLLDRDGNPLARQGIVHLREQMRMYDREHG